MDKLTGSGLIGKLPALEAGDHAGSTPVFPIMNLKKYIQMWESNDFPVEVKSAPESANTFDRMIIVYGDESKKHIRKVAFYLTVVDKITAEF